MIKFPLFKSLIICLWFSLILLLVFGSGVGLHYKVSPFLVLLSTLIIFYNNQKIRSKIIQTLLGFILISFITSYHYFLHIDHRASYISYFCYSITGFIVAITTYTTIKKDRRMINVIYYLMILFFIIGIFRFFRASSQIAYLHANTAYYFILMPLPCLLIKSNQRLFHISLLSVATILSVLSIKRGAIISVFLLWCIYFYYTFKFSKKSFLYICATMLIVGLFLVPKVNISNFSESATQLEERMSLIGEDGGSGRDAIIKSFFENDFNDVLRIPELFIGNGFEGTFYKYKVLSSLHNDFLEVTFCLGLVGLILLCILYYRLIKRTRSLYRCNSELIIPYISMVTLFIFFSIIGCNFNYYYLSLPLFLSLGILEGIYSI